jgi:hypothetical protein
MEYAHPALRMGLDPYQHVGEVLLGVDAVEDATAHEGLIDREALTGLVVSDEEEVLAAEGDEAEVALGDVMARSGICRVGAGRRALARAGGVMGPVEVFTDAA